MASIPISGLDTGTPNGDLEIPATNPLLETQSPNGTTEKYIFSDLFNYILEAQGLTAYASCVVATTANLDATYSNGSSGVGATLTNSGAQAALSIDGITLALTDRVLVKNQTSELENGIYTVTTVGSASENWVLTRASDFNQSSEIVEYGVVLIVQGTTNAGILYQETGSGPFTIGVTSIVFDPFEIQSTTALVTSVTGTENQVAVDGDYTNPQQGAVTLSLPQSIATTSSPEFNNLTLSGGNILDTNGNVSVDFVSAANAVNYLKLYNAPTGSGVSISVGGFDTNINLGLSSKGTGVIGLSSAATSNQFSLNLGTSYVRNTIFNFTATSGTNTLTFPSTTGTLALTSQVVLLSPSADQHITGPYNLFVDSGQINSGLAAGGTQGAIGAYPITANKGILQLVSMDNVGNYTNSIVNASTTASRTWTMPDATGTVALTNSVLSGYVLLNPSADQTILNAFNLIMDAGSLVAQTVLPGNLSLSSNTITPTNSNGDIVLQRNGSGGILIGDSTTPAFTFGTSNPLQIAKAGNNCTILVAAFANAAPVDASINLYRSRGATVGSYTALQSGDDIGYIVFNGADGTNSAFSSRVFGQVDAAVSTGIVPGRLLLQTANTSGTMTTAVTINSSQSATFAGLIIPSQTIGIQGTTTNNDANAGSIGEIISSVIASGSAVSLTTATPANVTSISLTAGDWDVWSNVTFIPGATTNVAQARGWVSSTSATQPDASLYSGLQHAAAGEVPADNFGFTPPSQRFSLSGTTTIYLSVTQAFSISTLSVCGGIYARRRR